MAQHNLRRSLAAFAFVTFATLSPFYNLSAEPARPGRPEPGARIESRGFSIWEPLQRFLAKYGARIDGNGLKYGARIDGNGSRSQVFTDSEADTDREREKYGARIDGNG
jgi:hypothetical protein